jgi:hypothetical protein
MPEPTEALTCVDAAPWLWRSQRSGHSLVLKALQQLPQALRAKGANPTFKEFTRQGQHLACIPTPDSPLKQAPVLVELNNIPQPLRAR